MSRRSPEPAIDAGPTLVLTPPSHPPGWPDAPPIGPSLLHLADGPPGRDGEAAALGLLAMALVLLALLAMPAPGEDAEASA